MVFESLVIGLESWAHHQLNNQYNRKYVCSDVFDTWSILKMNNCVNQRLVFHLVA